MGLLNDIIGLIGSAASADKNGTPNPGMGSLGSAASSVGNIVGNVLGGSNKSRSIVLSRFPRSVAELQTMPEASLQDEFTVAALSVAVLCYYEQNPQETVNMMNFLRGPRPLSPHEVQFLGERLAGKGYKMRSFFSGSSPENNYTPSQPWQVVVNSNPYSYQQQDYATLYLHSSGADNDRPITLRRKPSTGQWFVWEINYLSDIRVPANQDPWR